MSSQVREKVTILPAVPVEQDGTGMANTIRFVFDTPLGNWESYTLRDATGTVPDDQSTTRSHNAANQITAISQESPAPAPAAVAHDYAGNMTKAAPDKDGDWQKGYHLKWDAWNRLVEVRRQEDNTLVASYQYDGLFRRTLSTVGGANRHFLYDRAWRILEERPAAQTAAPDRLYLWGLRHRTDMVCRDAELPVPGSDSSASAGSSSTSLSVQRHYVAYDWISPTAILDPASGNPVERYSYSAFGQRKIMNPAFGERDASDYAWNFSFHGQFEDPETSFQNYGDRLFSSSAGRWINRDPLWEEGDVSLFRFLLNSPQNFIDDIGLTPVWPYQGINAPSGEGDQKGTLINGVQVELERKVHGVTDVEGGKISELGTPPKRPQNKSLIRLAPEKLADKEAEDMAAGMEGEWCNKTIRIIMVAPKTDTRPPKGKCNCCKYEIDVFWSPDDPVPNQSLFNEGESPEYWSEWGKTHTVRSSGRLFKPHNFSNFLRQNETLRRVRVPVHTYSGGRHSMTQEWRYEKDGGRAPNPVDLIKDAQRSGKYDGVAVCHSQGCNILMSILQRACRKKGADGNTK